MVVPKILREIKLSNVSNDVLRGILNLLGVNIDDATFTTLLSIKDTLVKGRPDIKVGDLLNDNEFINFVKDIGVSYLGKFGRTHPTVKEVEEIIRVGRGSLVKCPCCEAVGPIESFAPKLKNN